MKILSLSIFIIYSFSLLGQPPDFGKLPPIGGYPTVSPNPLLQMQHAEQQRILQQNERAMQLMQGNNTSNSTEKSRQQVYELLRESAAQHPRHSQAKNKQLQQHFQTAVYKLLNMSWNKANFSLKKAVFIVENSYYLDTLSYSKYEQQIQQVVAFCKKYCTHKGNSFKDYDSRIAALNAYFADTIKWADGSTFYPIRYDFDDAYGKKDLSKFFVTKLLKTRKGQCHSMPLLYKIAADEMQLNTYISLSPSHSYIQYKNSKGKLQSFETTNGHLVSEAWILSSGFVKTNALRNRVFLDTLSKQQLIWLCITDLLAIYEYRLGQDEFMLGVINEGLTQLPNNAQLLVAKANYVTNDVKKQLIAAGNPAYSALSQYPKLQSAVEYMHQLYEQIDGLGWTHIPETQYKNWLDKG